ncbi:hypothetical protein IF1G_07182 [Cordyceps javanica]|uniref:Uncharacterized protein n=1 Tax=Cordyceps javanica TaxID=43265 RepID=A0A545UXX4_9HYPO|nr:hypothetical protein IF1G_07182 [Cordyceps javanica]
MMGSNSNHGYRCLDHRGERGVNLRSASSKGIVRPPSFAQACASTPSSNRTWDDKFAGHLAPSPPRLFARGFERRGDRPRQPRLPP